MWVGDFCVLVCPSPNSHRYDATEPSTSVDASVNATVRFATAKSKPATGAEFATVVTSFCTVEDPPSLSVTVTDTW